MVLLIGVAYLAHKGVKMKRLIALFLLLGVSFAHAQTPVFTNTSKFTNSNYSSTISVTNTFQSVLASNLNRNDCIIQNNGAASMYLYFGALASAITNNSLVLSSGSIFRCSNSGVVLTDQISITGTATQRFFAIQY